MITTANHNVPIKNNSQSKMKLSVRKALTASGNRQVFQESMKKCLLSREISKRASKKIPCHGM